MLTKKPFPHRSKIDLHNSDEVRCWARNLGVSRAQLLAIAAKVGTSAAAIRKEIGTGSSEGRALRGMPASFGAGPAR